MSDACLLKREGLIATMVLNRPEQANALSRELVEQMGQHLEMIEREGEVRALIVTGAGDRVFCAGADLKERARMSPDEVTAFLAGAKRILWLLTELRCPTIVAFNGAALGGGLELALCCDLRLAAAGVKMGLVETSLAIIPGAGGTQRLPRVVGVARAKELIFTARRIDAEEACRIGLVSEVVPGDRLQARAEEVATAIAANGPVAVTAAKHAIDRGIALPLAEALEVEQICYRDVLDTEDRLEALRAFAEKRPARFQGR